MAEGTNSLSEILNSLGVQTANAQELISKMNQALTTNSSQVEVTQINSDDPTTSTTIPIPSIGYMNGRIEEIDTKFKTLLNANNSTIGVKDDQGNVKRFELNDITKTITDLEKIGDASLGLPTRFKTKNNWFFESFLSPLLYVPIDVTNYVSDDISKFEVRRVILNVGEDADLITYFDNNYKGKNTVNYTTLLTDLVNNGISYFEDTNIVDLPGAINRYRGTFKVQSISEITVPETINGEILSYSKIKYVLDKLEYTDVTGSTPAAQRRELSVGARLITEENSEYLVESVDTKDKSVILKRVFGSDGIVLFENLRIKPELYRSPVLAVNIGYNEREIIFIKPISSKMDLTVDFISNGFGIYTNELQITLQSGQNLTLNEYYNNFVADFGLLFLSFAKEKKLPNSLGFQPNSPTLNAANFKVLQIDSHVTNTDSASTVKNLVSQKESITSNLREIDKSIVTLKQTINSSGNQNDAIRLKAQSDLNNKTAARAQSFSQLSTVVKELSLNVKTSPEFSVSPKYRVRGFWEIPADIDSPYGLQKTVQFKIAYRYLSSNKDASAADPITFTDSTGAQRTGYFSPWTEVLTKSKQKIYNSTTGLYEWTEENVADPNSVNINQLDIAIRKGESVEIKIKSLSEAGFPDNPVESEWSESITVDFPSNIQSSEENTLIAQQAMADESRIALQEELNARGLDLHLSTSFSSKDKYYSHTTDSISSGFFLADGTAISLYDKLKEIADSLSAIQASLSTASAELIVSIVTPDGSEVQVTNGQTVDLFAGYYVDSAKLSDGALDKGKIVSKEYQVKIRNASQTPLELISTLGGGIGVAAPTSFPGANTDTQYNAYLRYDKAPINLNGVSSASFAAFTQRTGYQSSQVKSQYVYARYYSADNGKKLYYGDLIDSSAFGSNTNPSSYFTNQNYTFSQSTNAVSGKPNYMGGHYLPTIPLGGSTAEVWNGTVVNGLGQGNGTLTEFCIHKDHPYFSVLGTVSSPVSTTTINNIFLGLTTNSVYEFSNNTITSTAQKYLPFSQAIHFNTSAEAGTNEFGVPYYAQAERVTPVSPSAYGGALYTALDTFPIKLGFGTGDDYLIGKKTCGAYLFMMPQSYASISVDGSNARSSKRTVMAGSAASITVPVVFQFRTTDKIGEIGGWSTGQKLTNITYTKIIGLDIYTKSGLFEFDIQVSGKHQRDTIITSPTIFTPVSAGGGGGGGVYISDLTDILKNSAFNLSMNSSITNFM